MFEYLGIPWRESTTGREHIPLFSDLSERQITHLCMQARQNGTMRSLVESAAVLDPVLADFLYILDNTTSIGDEITVKPSQEVLRLTNWQSYGRRDVKELIAEADRVVSAAPAALVLPCSRKRPYGQSRTHRRIYTAVKEHGVNALDAHRIVITSLGVIPEELWKHPVVLGYDAGVPDVYRNLRLARAFFTRNRYANVIDCLEFPPYSDVLRILAAERIIPRITRIELRRSRQFWIKHS